MSIEAESYRILAERVDLAGFGPLGQAVAARVVHATADPSLVATLCIDEEALQAGVAALRRDAAVVCDVEMVRAGVAAPHACCHLHEGVNGEPTRSAAGVRAAARAHPADVVVVVGCAPTALDEVVRLYEEAAFRPALVIGLPVGYVGAADAKRAVRASGMPAVTNAGERGGSAVAAAAFNALWRIARGG